MKTFDNVHFGNVVQLRDGNLCLMVASPTGALFASLSSGGCIKCSDYNDDLTIKLLIENDYDIMRVYKDFTCKELLWERKKKSKSKLTDDEKVILRNIDKRYKYIARDEDGVLRVFENKPYKDGWLGDNFWTTDDDWIDSEFSDNLCVIFNHLFQFIKWTDDEPYSIKNLLKGGE